MALENITSSITTTLKSVKEISDTISSFWKNIDDMLGLKSQEQEVIDDSHQKIETIKKEIEQQEQSPEQKKMLSVLSEYCRLFLSQDEIKSCDNIFLGNSLEEHLQEYLQEQQYIRSEQLKGNYVPSQALQKAFDIYDPTTAIQTVLQEISDLYFAQQWAKKFQNITTHFQSLIADKTKIADRKKVFVDYTPETRLKTKPNPDLIRYHDEQTKLKTIGLAYDVNREKDPQMKTPENILKRFVSSGVRKNPKTGVTLCSQTTALDSQRLLWKQLPKWNAFDVMRWEQGDFSQSLISELYDTQEKSKKRVGSIHPNWNLWKNDYINALAPQDSNVADLFVTSSTPKWKIYGHRALMFRLSNQWYVLDPYTAVQPGEDKNKPRTLESYARSMKTGNNKREFMRMNFYKAPVDLESKAIA